jgi:hypothetical protein
MRCFFPALLALVLTSPPPASCGGWPSGDCATVVAPIPEWEWRKTADGTRADLYHYGRYCRSHYYETEAPPKEKTCGCTDACECGESCPCPGGKPCCDGCPCAPKSEAFPHWMTHGTDPAKIAPREEYRVGGKVVTRDEALKALQGAPLADDSQKLRLTVIGSADERRKALAALPGDVKDRCLVKEYAPDHWSVRGAGFKTDGHPTVYVQAPDGKVLHRQDDADNVAQAVRKADPGYDPARDPDLRKPKPPDRPAPAPDNSQSPATGWVVAGLVALGAYLWKGSKVS